jgi:dihydrofolate reductase
MSSERGQPNGGRALLLAPGFVVEGMAIVSADGMIADANGVQPQALIVEADQRFFRERLDAADALVHGRNSGEGGPDAAKRRRIVLTRRIAGAERDPDNSKVVFWNPARAPFEAAWALLGLPPGRIAVIGGTDVFGLFLGRPYDVFHLTRAGNVRLPGGRPVFPGVPAASPDRLLAGSGLKPDATRVLDASGALTLVTWRR